MMRRSQKHRSTANFRFENDEHCIWVEDSASIISVRLELDNAYDLSFFEEDDTLWIVRLGESACLQVRTTLEQSRQLAQLLGCELDVNKMPTPEEAARLQQMLDDDRKADLIQKGMA